MKTPFALYDHPSQMEPLLPRESVCSPLLELAGDVIRRSDALSGGVKAGALQGLRQVLRAMNSYYTNRIERQHTLPAGIDAALASDYSQDAELARKQRLALAYMDSEAALERAWLSDAREPAESTEKIEQNGLKWVQNLWSQAGVCALHQDLFARLSPEDRRLEDGSILQPGELRTQEVSVGRHAAPKAACLPDFLARWGAVYGGVRRGEMQLLAALAGHQRLAWIHPFRDGNGRVARLHTYAALGQMGLTNGLWSPVRGFARSHEAYYAHLAAADDPRAGDLDGRGNLTERGLVAWLEYSLQICLDQVRFMREQLRLDTMKDRIAACLVFEENVLKSGVRTEALMGLHYLFAIQGEIERSQFKAILGLGDRLASAQVAALLKRGLLRSDSPYGKLRFGVPQHALRFYFPGLWPEAEVALY